MGRGDEHLRTFYPAADRDLAADARACWCSASAPIACCRSRRCRTSISRRSSVSANYPGASPRHDGLGGRDAARTAIRRDPGLDQMTLDERRRHRRRSRCSSTSSATSTPPRRTCSRRSMRPPAFCRRTCRTRRPTARPTRPTAPVLIYAVHSDALPVYRIDDYAYTILAQKLSTRAGRVGSRASSARSPMRRASRSTRRRSPRAASASRTSAPRSSAATRQPAEGQYRGAHQSSRSTPTTSCSTPPASATSSSPTATARRCGSGMSATSSTRCRTRASAPGSSDKPAEGLAIQREAGANTIEVVDTVKALMPQARSNRSRPRSMSTWCPTARW